MRRLGRYFIGFLAIIGLLTVSLVALGIWAAIHFSDKGEASLPGSMVLILDLEAQFHEANAANPLARLTGDRTYALREVVESIDRAVGDERVTGLFATLGHAKMGLAGAQEIRDAVARFKASGKPAVVFAETMGEFGNGTLDYYLASGFGQVWLQPSGDVGLTGFMLESPFVKGTFELLGIQPQFGARHEYKSAIESFTEKGFTDKSKESLNSLLDSFMAQIVAGIAQGRAMPPEKVRALIGNPLLASEALSAGLVDKLGYRDDAIASASGTGKPKEVDVRDYAGHAPSASGTKIAVITGTGAIKRGEAEDGFGGDREFASATIAKAFRDAVEDADVKGIVFRIDSPGGSYVASDSVWHEVRRARAAGKPVVASMGNAAASGGYFVAMGADRVIAQPGTITGSIGVFSGKFVMRDFWNKIGISWDEVHRGENAPMWSFNREFSPQAWDRMNTMLDRIYADFTTKAAEGRNIPKDRMDALARGRVWTGADAQRLGLVDKLGGYDVALAEMRGLLKLEAGAPLKLADFPKPGPLEMLAKTLSGSRAEEPGVQALMRLGRVMAPMAERLEAMQGGDVLMMPPGMAPR